MSLRIERKEESSTIEMSVTRRCTSRAHFDKGDCCESLPSSWGRRGTRLGSFDTSSYFFIDQITYEEGFTFSVPQGKEPKLVQFHRLTVFMPAISYKSRYRTRIPFPGIGGIREMDAGIVV